MTQRAARDPKPDRAASDAALGTRDSPYLSFRCPEPLMLRLDASVTRWRNANLGVNITRSDVVRSLLTRALTDDEALVRAPARKSKS